MTTLLEEYAALALDKQTTLNRITDTAAAWFVDQTIGQLTLGDEHFTIHWLGTYSHHSGSWLWAWANPHLTMTTNDAASADILRAYIAPDAAAEGDDSTNLFQNPADTALLTQEGFKLDVTELHNLAAVACGLTGADAYYLGDYGDGIALLAIHDPRVAAAWQEDDSPARILSIIPQTINLFDLNHQNAVRAYLTAKGYQLNEDAQHIRAQRADSQITATFDDMQRLSNLSGSVSPT